MKISALIASATLVIGLAACSNDSSPDVTSAQVSPVVGTYALKSVDGQQLPWSDPTYHMTIISSAWSLKADGTWEDAVAYLDGTNGGDHGTYSVSGDSVSVMLGTKTFRASIASGVFSVLAGGHLYTFQQF